MIPQKRLRETGISVYHRASKDAYTLIPKTCENVTLHGKRNFADMIQLRILR